MCFEKSTAMKNVYQSLLLLIAGATQKEPAEHVRCLKVENEILRCKLPNRVDVTDKEKTRLAKFAQNLGPALKELVSICHPDTSPRRSQSELRVC